MRPEDPKQYAVYEMIEKGVFQLLALPLRDHPASALKAKACEPTAPTQNEGGM